jgi:hypothetical protein
MSTRPQAEILREKLGLDQPVYRTVRQVAGADGPRRFRELDLRQQRAGQPDPG